MITEAILTLVLDVVHSILDIVPDIDLQTLGNVAASGVQYLEAAFYILPMGTVFTIISLLVVLQGFRIAVSVIKTIWALLPLV